MMLLCGSHVARAQDGPRPAPRVDEAPPPLTPPPAQYPPRVAPPAPAIEQVKAGDALMAAARYQEAAAQYEAAYAIDPALVILERLADAYRLAGDSQRAAILYQRIAAQRNVERGYPAGMQLAPPLLFAVQKPPGQSMLNTGIGLFAGGYGIAVSGGIIGLAVTSTIGSSGSRETWYGASGLLLVPVIGPFATIGYQSDPIWAVPWALISGGMQLSGLALMIVGGITRARHRKAPPVAVSPVAGPGMQGLSVSGTF